MALTGPTSSDTGLALYGYAEQNRVPYLVPVAAFPRLTQPGTKYTFRLEPNAVGWGYAIAQFVAKQKPGAKIALVYSDFALMRAIAAGLKYQAPLSGVKIEPEIVFPQGANDATVQVAQVRAANPDYVVSVGGGGFDNTLTNQLLDIGIKPEQIIHPYFATNQVLSWGKRSVGSFYGTFFDANLDKLTPEGKDFVTKSTAENGRPPSYLENFCYVTAHVIRQVLDNVPEAADDREKFRSAVSALKMKEPTSGLPIEFDKNGARVEYIYIMQMQEVAEKNYKAKEVYYTEWDPEGHPSLHSGEITVIVRRHACGAKAAANFSDPVKAGGIAMSDGTLIILLSTLSTGLLLGAIFALVATGVTIVYGSIWMPNAANGQFFLLAALFGWSMTVSWGINPALAAVLGDWGQRAPVLHS